MMIRHILLERKDGRLEQVPWKGGNWGAVEHAKAELRRGRAVSAQVREADGRLIWFSEEGS